MYPTLSIIICSLNGADGVALCLKALDAQTIREALEVILVDDGSTDGTHEVGHSFGVIVTRHQTNRGLAAARNSGIEVATAPIVAFLDDDCEPDARWAEELVTAYADGILGTGGPIIPSAPRGYMIGYLQRNNPLKPQERDLATSPKFRYRLYLYLKRQWMREEHLGRRRVYSFAGANMSFRRQALIDIDNFDERFHFGAEELDLCMRINEAFPEETLLYVPEATVVHHFVPSLRDTLRRSRAYGRGSARLYRKWPTVLPTLFPGPVIVTAALLVLSVLAPMLVLIALLLPQALYPQASRHAFTTRSVACLLDAYVQLAQETCENLGFLWGLWIFRHFLSGPLTAPISTALHSKEVERIS